MISLISDERNAEIPGNPDWPHPYTAPVFVHSRLSRCLHHPVLLLQFLFRAQCRLIQGNLGRMICKHQASFVSGPGPRDLAKPADSDCLLSFHGNFLMYQDAGCKPSLRFRCAMTFDPFTGSVWAFHPICDRHLRSPVKLFVLSNGHSQTDKTQSLISSDLNTRNPISPGKSGLLLIMHLSAVGDSAPEDCSGRPSDYNKLVGGTQDNQSLVSTQSISVPFCPRFPRSGDIGLN